MLFQKSENWRGGMQEVAAAIDETMGEPVTITPANAPKPNFSTVSDPSRAVTVTGVFTSTPKTIIGGNEGRLGSYSVSPLIETHEPTLSFSRNALPIRIEQGYRLTLCRTGETFEAKGVQSDGVSRIVVTVVQLGRMSEKR